jgi:hypothetical protein
VPKSDLVLLPPTGSDSPSFSFISVLPGFGEQKRKVIQILKDWKLPYSTGPGSGDGVKTDSSSGSSWLLNGEVFQTWNSDEFAQSRKNLMDALSELRRVSHLLGNLSCGDQHDSYHRQHDPQQLEAE